MKPASAFKFSQSSKRMIANINDPHKRGEIKRLMILAQLHEEDAARKPIKMDKSKQED